jgi:hypothetical protein
MNWKGIGMIWLLLLMLACWTPLYIQMQVGLNTYVDQHGKALASQFPTITIADGKATVDAPQPLTIVEPASGEVIGVIDTTGQINSLADTEARVLMTASEVMFQKNAIENRSMSFDQIDQFTLDAAKVESILQVCAKYGPLVLTVFAAFFVFLSRLFQMLVYALVGLIFVNKLSVNLSFAALMRLALAAMTPTLIVNTLVVFLPFSIPFHGLLNLIVSLVIMYVVIKSISEDQISGSQFNSALTEAPMQRPLGTVPEPWDEKSYPESNVPPSL